MSNANGSSACEAAEVAMKATLMELLSVLTAWPADCSVDIVRCGEVTNFVVKMKPEDFARLTSGSVETAKSLKLLVRAVGMKRQRNFSMILCNENGNAGDSAMALSNTAGPD